MKFGLISTIFQKSIFFVTFGGKENIIKLNNAYNAFTHIYMSKVEAKNLALTFQNPMAVFVFWHKITNAIEQPLFTIFVFTVLLMIRR